MRYLNVGTVADDGTGQTLRSSMIDIQFNFDELSETKANILDLPTKVVSTTTPSGIPANGDEWIMYDN